MVKLRLFSFLIICFFSLGAISQNKGLALSLEQFNYSNKKSNISNHWSWFSISYFHPINAKLSFAGGLNINTSYLLARSPTGLYNIIPRGKTIFEKIGLCASLNYLLKSHSKDVYWFANSQITLNNTYLYGATIQYDSVTNVSTISNQYFQKKPIVKLDLGVTLRARISNPFFVEVRPAFMIFPTEMNFSGGVSNNSIYFKGQVSLFYRFADE